ncbi:MAG: hypothetical protein JWM65_1333 [Sphingomonas bacterium]|nr:hypothetical protein [Sphingomonas bacterium]
MSEFETEQAGGAGGDAAPTDTESESKATGAWRVPPVEHRFKKGQSGNPTGKKKHKPGREPWRPLGSDEPTRKMILREAYRKVRVRDGDREVKMPTNQAVFRAMAAAAIDGNRVAQHLWTQIVRRAEREEAEAYGAYLGEAMDYKLNWTKVLREGGPGALPEDLYPHPDDVLIDPRTGRVEIRGAMCAEEQREVDVVLAVRTMHQEEYTRFETALTTTTDEQERAALIERRIRAEILFELCNERLAERLQVGLVVGEE